MERGTWMLLYTHPSYVSTAFSEPAIAYDAIQRLVRREYSPALQFAFDPSRYMIPSCPHQLPEHLTEPLHQFAAAWVESPLRPRVTREVARAWDLLVEEWIRATALPLYIRKSSATRGEVISHHTGRPLIPCDNTTAVWAFTLAVEASCPTLAQVVASVRSNEIPFAFTGLRGRFAQFYAAGWKLAHIEDVGLQTRERLENIPIAVLEGR